MYLSDNKLIPVTDPIKVGIMAVLSESDRTLADMSRILETPLSTLFSNLNKMVEDGLIESFSHSDDKRKVLYSQKAVKLIESKKPEPGVAGVASEVLNNAMKDPTNFYKSIVTYVSMITTMTGLDLGPLFERAGRIMANIKKDDFQCEKVEDLIPKIKEFCTKADMPDITVFTFVPLTIILHLENYGSKDAPNMFRSTKGFITQALSNLTGMSYTVTSSEVFGDGYNKLKIVLEPNNNPTDITAEVLGDDNVSGVMEVVSQEYFELYATMNGIVYNSNDTQIKIMNELSTFGDATLSDLARKLGISQSTIFANLNKMVDDKLIASADSEVDNRKVVYRAISTRFMTKKKSTEGNHKRAYDVMKKAKADPHSFYRSVFEFLIYETDTLGLDFTDTANTIGMALAMKVKELYPDVSVEQFVKMICESPEIVGARSFAVVTYIPLTITMGCHLDPVEAIANVVNKFYGGFLSLLLSITSGTTYLVTSTHDLVDGEIKYEYVLESSPNTRIPRPVIFDMLVPKE